MNTFYVYIHYRKSNNIPFYVGKGKNRRLKVKHRRNPYWHNIVNKHGFYPEIIEKNLTEDEALYWESYWIWQLKSWNYKLANGIFEDKKRIITEESRKRMSDAHLGQSAWNKGKVFRILKIHNRPAEWRSCRNCENGFLARLDKITQFCSNACCNKYNGKLLILKNKINA